LSGETFANAGRVTVSGVDIADKPPIAYCPQFDALANDLTGREVLTLIGKLNGFQSVNERVKRVLDSICLMNKANSLVKYYSGGQKRRLSIGVTLMSKSSLIMLDEPSAGESLPYTLYNI
jgi:ATP-binding cassette subfamily A (ABC1) protein 3